MRTSKELSELSAAIGKAINAYHNAVMENLKEGGKEYPIYTDDEDNEGFVVEVIGRHNDLINTEVDKIRYNNERGIVEVHICREDYEAMDYWLTIWDLGDATDYILDNIIWD